MDLSHDAENLQCKYSIMMNQNFIPETAKHTTSQEVQMDSGELYTGFLNGRQHEYQDAVLCGNMLNVLTL
jgi:hypothetical protein